MNDDRDGAATERPGARPWTFAVLALAAAVAGMVQLAADVRDILTRSLPVIPVFAALLLMLAGSLWRATVWSQGSNGGGRSREHAVRTALFVMVVAVLFLGVPWVLSTVL